MLEIIFVIRFSIVFGDHAVDKGYSRGLFRGLAIGAWFTGEVIAGIVSLIVFQFNPLPGYLIALGGSLGGIGIIALILFLLPEKDGADGTGVPKNWTCPACGLRNTGWRGRCFKCDAERPERKTRGWTCPACGGLNLESDEGCYKCQRKKPSTAG